MSAGSRFLSASQLRRGAAITTAGKERTTSNRDAHPGTLYPIRLIPVDLLSPTEKHCDSRAADLAKTIETTGIWTTPILIEEQQLFVMDGHHRLRAASLLNLAALPCILMRYEDPRLRLSSWSSLHAATPKDIACAAKSGRLLAYKTTRHELDPAPSKIAVPLPCLLRGIDRRLRDAGPRVPPFAVPPNPS